MIKEHYIGWAPLLDMERVNKNYRKLSAFNYARFLRTKFPAKEFWLVMLFAEGQEVKLEYNDRNPYAEVQFRKIIKCLPKTWGDHKVHSNHGLSELAENIRRRKAEDNINRVLQKGYK